MMQWPVMPLCKKQLLDVRSEHVLNSGLFRLCDTYLGGGGYDQFPTIHERRTGQNPGNLQFVVQLRGCPLKCPYCYVTDKGIWGEDTPTSSHTLLKAYADSRASIFHLMGGAPALYLHAWKELASKVEVFHSDFILVEGEYRREDLLDLPGVHAVSMKDFPVNFDLMWRNLDMLVGCGVNFYLTFTGEPLLREVVRERYGDWILEDSFVIPINSNYSALNDGGCQ